MHNCIGIISGLPDGELRNIRKEKFLNLLEKLDTYFKLPIIIIAQNGKEEDYNLKYSSSIKIYSYNNGLGIVKARIELCNRIKSTNYDCCIFLDDDTDLICTKEGVERYFNEIDNNKNKVGLFRSNGGRLLSIPTKLLDILNFNYIRNLDPSKGDLGEDTAWYKTGSTIYPNLFYRHRVDSYLDEVFIPSENNPASTGYKKEFGNLYNKSMNIVKGGVNYEKMHRNN